MLRQECNTEEVADNRAATVSDDRRRIISERGSSYDRKPHHAKYTRGIPGRATDARRKHARYYEQDHAQHDGAADHGVDVE